VCACALRAVCVKCVCIKMCVYKNVCVCMCVYVCFYVCAFVCLRVYYAVAALRNYSLCGIQGTQINLNKQKLGEP